MKTIKVIKQTCGNCGKYFNIENLQIIKIGKEKFKVCEKCFVLCEEFKKKYEIGDE